jgi:hypothetical protein
MSAFPEGKLLVALWKLPGSSRTPLVTLRAMVRSDPVRPGSEALARRGGVMRDGGLTS